jgi:predicted XRE-type DNA-binding protein
MVDMTKELLEWEKPLTQEQIQKIENRIDSLANSLDELAEFIETADHFIQEEDAEGNWHIGDVPFEDGSIDIFEHGGYSKDTVAWVQSSILSAKKLRSELEKIMGEDGAKEFYQQLQVAFHLVIGEKGVLMVTPDSPILPERHDSSAKLSAELIRQKSKHIADEMITQDEAARLLEVDKGTVTRYANSGKLKDNDKKGRGRRYSKASVLFLADRKREKERQKGYKDYSNGLDSIPEKH